MNLSEGKADMNTDGKSDGFVVPSTRANKTGTEPAAESVEERNPAKRNVDQTDLPRAPKRTKRKSLGLAGVRENSAIDSRQEPYEVVLQVRICAGGRWQQRFLPRSNVR